MFSPRLDAFPNMSNVPELSSEVQIQSSIRLQSGLKHISRVQSRDTPLSFDDTRSLTLQLIAG